MSFRESKIDQPGDGVCLNLGRLVSFGDQVIGLTWLDQWRYGLVHAGAPAVERTEYFSWSLGPCGYKSDTSDL